MLNTFKPYWEWEDYQAGMYNSHNLEDEVTLLNLAKDILSDVLYFDREARKMIDCWVNSKNHNLNNKSINRKAWIGQATCCYTQGVPERLTKIAWSELSMMQQFLANKVADKIIKEYEEKNRKIYQDMGIKGLF